MDLAALNLMFKGRDKQKHASFHMTLIDCSIVTMTFRLCLDFHLLLSSLVLERLIQTNTKMLSSGSVLGL